MASIKVVVRLARRLGDSCEGCPAWMRWSLRALLAVTLAVAPTRQSAAAIVNLPISRFDFLQDPENDAQTQNLFSWRKNQNRLEIVIGDDTPSLNRQYPFGNPIAKGRLELGLNAAPSFRPSAARLRITGIWRNDAAYEAPENDDPNIRDNVTIGNRQISFDQLARDSASFRECAESGGFDDCEFSFQLDNLSGLVDQNTNKIILQTDYADGDTRNQLSDSSGDSVFELTAFQLVIPSIRGVHLFYNNSALDGNGSTVSSTDFAAIAPDKQPLRFGQTATSAHVSGYSRGVNGLFIDFEEAPDNGQRIAPDDFVISTGNNSFPETWTPASSPSVGVMPRQGEGGSDRVFLAFPDGLINNTWLRVTVLANDDTGLGLPEDYFFGAAGGETGAAFTPNVVGVDAADLQSIASNLTPLADSGTELATNPNDVNRDRTINAFDLQTVALNLNPAALQYITPQFGAAGAAVPEPATAASAAFCIALALAAGYHRRKAACWS